MTQIMTTRIIYIFLILLLPLQGWTKDVLKQADQAYQQSNYAQAIELYETYLHQSVTDEAHCTNVALSDCYYNLGNSYYRSKNWGKAVLNYQRAIRINPQNVDASFNLELTETKLKDQFDAPSEMFFFSWIKSLIHSRNSTQWGVWAWGFLILSIVCFFLYIWGKRLTWRKIGIYGSILSLALLILTHLFAYQQYKKFREEIMIVLLNEANLYEAPSTTSKQLQTLHEGTSLIVLETIQDNPSDSSWFNVELPNGMRAWIKNENIEKVIPETSEQNSK